MKKLNPQIQHKILWGIFWSFWIKRNAVNIYIYIWQLVLLEGASSLCMLWNKKLFSKEELPIVLPSGGLYSLQLLWIKFPLASFIQKQASLFRHLFANWFKQWIHRIRVIQANADNKWVLFQVTVDWFLDGSFGHLYRVHAVM